MKLRKPRSRRGGAVATLVGFVIFLVVITSVAKAFMGVLNPLAQSGDECGMGAPLYLNLAGNSTVKDELRDPAFWSMVQASARETVYNIVNDTVEGTSTPASSGGTGPSSTCLTPPGGWTRASSPT